MNVSLGMDMNKYFICQNGENISWTSVCDGFNQCIDGSDERNCYCQGDTYACLQGNNVSCKVACATYGRVTCLTYQNSRACEQYIQKTINTMHFDISSTQESPVLTYDFDTFRYSVYLAVGILLFIIILSLLIYLIHKYSSQLLFSCTNKSFNRISTTRLSSRLQQQSSSLNLPRSHYTPAPNINDLPPSYHYTHPISLSINGSYEPRIYPDPSLYSSINYSDSIYYETIKTPSKSNSMSMLHPMPLPEPQGFVNIRTYCV
ncbi:unnamed protein product [Adineta steineri]|uniref:Uncharacterized protein n=1 Tax=Adineta steineri TaxID=433720 RepID=A0A815ED08_9BILA|nr:unnamed protein product [Adineta steineri]